MNAALLARACGCWRHPPAACAKLRTMGAVPGTFAQERSAELGRATSSLLHLRLLFLPIVATITFWHWSATGASKERLALICAFFAVLAVHIAFLFRQRRRGVQTRSLGFAGTVTALGLSSLTGGLDSEFVIVLPATAVMSALGGPRWEGWAAAGAQLAALPLLALAGGTRPVFTMLTIAGGVAFALPVGLVLRQMFERMLARLTRTYDDVLRMHSEQMQSLTTLSTRIAGELRTPLDTIGTVSQAARDALLRGGSAAEQLDRLRSETARMQQLVEAFLNFSRPLSPLSLDTVDAARLGRQVVDLFQGVAHERQLSLALTGDALHLRCDPRKLKQVLINLVHNAVESSSPGGAIGIELHASSREAAIRVVHRGFRAAAGGEPGLRWTIARSIAEQHGGSLDVRDREGGGSVAELILPVAAAEGRAA
jgi:signal transduction histidine kinase